MSLVCKGVARVYFFIKALAKFQHVHCMIVLIRKVKRVACYARAETFTEAVASCYHMPLVWYTYMRPLCNTVDMIFTSLGTPRKRQESNGGAVGHFTLQSMAHISHKFPRYGSLGAPSERISLALRNPECCDGKLMVGKDQWFDIAGYDPHKPIMALQISQCK